MWFSVVYSFIDNDTRHHSGQNLLRTHSAAPCESTTFWPLWWRVSLSIKPYTMLNHIRFVNYTWKVILYLVYKFVFICHQIDFAWSGKHGTKSYAHDAMLSKKCLSAVILKCKSTIAMHDCRSQTLLFKMKICMDMAERLSMAHVWLWSKLHVLQILHQQYNLQWLILHLRVW